MRLAAAASQSPHYFTSRKDRHTSHRVLSWRLQGALLIYGTLTMLSRRFFWQASQFGTVHSKLSQEPQLCQCGQGFCFKLNEQYFVGFHYVQNTSRSLLLANSLMATCIRPLPYSPFLRCSRALLSSEQLQSTLQIVLETDHPPESPFKVGLLSTKASASEVEMQQEARDITQQRNG